MNDNRPSIGMQGSVMGWDDPWHAELCKIVRRTGEGQMIPSQDPKPSPQRFLALLRELGVDFYVHHVMPDEEEIDTFIASMATADFPYMMANEYGDKNGEPLPGTNRYDIPAAAVGKARETGRFLGLILDETEHRQLHPTEEERAARRFQWTDPAGKTLQQAEDDLVDEVRKLVGRYGGDTPIYSEHVFPVLYHAFARGGLHPCPKLLKEEFQSVQLCTAIGAANQYGRSLGICVDLWGQDVGAWFTRLWGFPGHSPEEFRSALRLAYLMGPDFLFVENIDPLVRHLGSAAGFRNTAFGDVFEEFARQFVPGHPISYSYRDAAPDVVLIRADDTDFAVPSTELPWSFGGRLYGSETLEADVRTQSAMHAFHLLSHGTIPVNGITFFLPQYKFPAGDYSRTEATLRQLPLPDGVGVGNEVRSHGLFYPINNMIVLDERADARAIGNPKLIVLAGSRMTAGCLKAVADKVRGGAVCIACRWLLPEQERSSRREGLGRWIVIDDLLGEAAREAAAPFLGSPDCWRQRFGDIELSIYDADGSGDKLAFETREA